MENKVLAPSDSSKHRKARRPDMQLYVPRGRRSDASSGDELNRSNEKLHLASQVTSATVEQHKPTKDLEDGRTASNNAMKEEKPVKKVTNKECLSNRATREQAAVLPQKPANHRSAELRRLKVNSERQVTGKKNNIVQNSLGDSNCQITVDRLPWPKDGSRDKSDEIVAICTKSGTPVFENVTLQDGCSDQGRVARSTSVVPEVGENLKNLSTSDVLDLQSLPVIYCKREFGASETCENALLSQTAVGNANNNNCETFYSTRSNSNDNEENSRLQYKDVTTADVVTTKDNSSGLCCNEDTPRHDDIHLCLSSERNERLGDADFSNYEGITNAEALRDLILKSLSLTEKSDNDIVSDGRTKTVSPENVLRRKKSGTEIGRTKHKISATPGSAKSMGERTEHCKGDEDSWDSLFDENGDCLNPTIMTELTDSLGEVDVQKSKFDYLDFRPQDPDFSGDEFSHVVELYDFPAEFKTQDLITTLSSFKERGFNIKWVDDTHALAIFSSSIAATEALSIHHPMVKVRPLSQAISNSKWKAKRYSEDLLPYKPRPATTASLARRLVSGALGLRVAISKEQRDQERQRLQQAKERKRQVAKQKQDIWDGTVS